MVLNEGKIAEMRTGEGKTLVATLAVYLNALSSKGVHVVTVNDYLAKRDANWMRPLYEFLDMSVGVVFSVKIEMRKKHPIYAILPMEPITNLVLIIFAIIWFFVRGSCAA